MYDAIIVGSGTVGLTIANLLSNLGLKICLIEKGSVTNDVSKAVGVNDECLLAWQLCGVLEKISDYIGYNQEGEIILKYFDAEKRKIFALHQSLGVDNFPKGVVILQNKIDEILLQNLRGKVDLFFDEEVIGIIQNHEFIAVNTKKNSYETKYLIAADGRESSVRQLLGIKINLLSE